MGNLRESKNGIKLCSKLLADKQLGRQSRVWVYFLGVKQRCEGQREREGVCVVCVYECEWDDNNI